MDLEFIGANDIAEAEAEPKPAAKIVRSHLAN